VKSTYLSGVLQDCRSFLAPLRAGEEAARPTASFFCSSRLLHTAGESGDNKVEKCRSYLKVQFEMLSQPLPYYPWNNSYITLYTGAASSSSSGGEMILKLLCTQSYRRDMF